MRVGHAGAPKRWGKDNHRQQKKDAGDLEPKNSAHASEWPQKASHALAHAASGLRRELPGSLRGGAVPDGGVAYLGGRCSRRTGNRLRLGGNPLSSYASGDSNSNAQCTADGSRSHSVYDGSSGSLRVPCSVAAAPGLLSDGNGSKVEISCRNLRLRAPGATLGGIHDIPSARTDSATGRGHP
jgi:hypothetical protein